MKFPEIFQFRHSINIGGLILKIKPILLTLMMSSVILIRLPACDPILEALIFSQDKVTRLDRHFREFSTRLNEAGSSWRLKGSITDTLVTQLRSLWFSIYQLSYLYTPESWTMPKSQWQSKMDEIAALLKELLSIKKGRALHSVILRLQNRLVELYQPYDSRDISSRLSYLKHRKHLYLRSLEDAPEEADRIYSSMLKIVEELEIKEIREMIQFKVILDEYLKINENEEQAFWKKKGVRRTGSW